MFSADQRPLIFRVTFYSGFWHIGFRLIVSATLTEISPSQEARNCGHSSPFQEISAEQGMRGGGHSRIRTCLFSNNRAKYRENRIFVPLNRRLPPLTIRFYGPFCPLPAPKITGNRNSITGKGTQETGKIPSTCG
jgi:hypothetical protein